MRLGRVRFESKYLAIKYFHAKKGWSIRWMCRRLGISNKDEKSLRSAIDKYIHFYNYERFQERFDNRTPMEVRTEALNSHKPTMYPIPENRRIKKYKAKFAA